MTCRAIPAVSTIAKSPRENVCLKMEGILKTECEALVEIALGLGISLSPNEGEVRDEFSELRTGCLRTHL